MRFLHFATDLQFDDLNRISVEKYVCKCLNSFLFLNTSILHIINPV